MAPTLKTVIRESAVRFFRAIGSDIHDARSGRKLGRALLIPWRGRIHLLGLEAGVRVVPFPQNRLTYWHQSVGFSTHPTPDFPQREPARSMLAASSLKHSSFQPLVVVLDHRDPVAVRQLIDRWIPKFCQKDNLLLAYGGPEALFSQIEFPQKIFIEDPRLRTRDHQREAQSYRGVLRKVSSWLAGREFTHILFMESDHLPISPDLLNQYFAHLSSESADLLGYQLERYDGTTHPHHLHALATGWDSDVTLSMLGTGHFWKREAWDAVASSSSPPDLYLEMDLATTAHRLGFRIRPIPQQESFVKARPELLAVTSTDARTHGAWTLHPVKLPAG